MRKSSEKNKILFDRLVAEIDLPLLDTEIERQIGLAIEKKLTTNPELYGEPLRGKLKGYWKLRVRDWRVVYKIGNKETFILGIRHRTRIYDILQKRIQK